VYSWHHPDGDSCKDSNEDGMRHLSTCYSFAAVNDVVVTAMAATMKSAAAAATATAYASITASPKA